MKRLRLLPHLPKPSAMFSAMLPKPSAMLLDDRADCKRLLAPQLFLKAIREHDFALERIHGRQ